MLAELDDNGLTLSLATRRELAAEAFAHTAGYDATIANWFTEASRLPRAPVRRAWSSTRELPYGENPHQRAAYYSERGARRHVLSMVHQHGGRGVTFNNIADISAGRDIAREFTLPACVIIKHTNPCGVAMGARIEDAFANALAATRSRRSAAWSTSTAPSAWSWPRRWRRSSSRSCSRPAYDDGAVDMLASSQNLRILESRERRRSNPGERGLRRVLGRHAGPGPATRSPRTAT